MKAFSFLWEPWRLGECGVGSAMRVLISTTSGVGHIFPVLPLAIELQRQGHSVIWATSQESCSIVEGKGIAASPAGLTSMERAQRFSANNPDALVVPPRQRRALGFSGLMAATAGPVMMDALVPLFDQFRPDLVVHETAELAAPPIARSKNVPCVTVAFSGELPQSVLAAGVVAAAPLWSRLGLEVPPDLGMYDGAYLHPFAPALGQRPLGANIHDMKPFSIDAHSYDCPDWLESLGTERPLVYATYGSEAGARAPWEAIIGGLAIMDVDAVVTVGRGVNRESLLAMVADLSPGRIMIEHYIPQAILMERSDVVLSHGGAGSMLAAAVAGLPQIVIPSFADQFDNTDAFVGAGVALAIEDGELSSQKIADQLHHILEDTFFRESAGVLSRAFSEMSSPEVIAARLVELV